MHRVGANNDFVGNALVELEFVRMQNHAHKHSVGLVEINDFHTVLCKCDGGIGQNVFERGG
jgi:hypothetical protein